MQKFFMEADVSDPEPKTRLLLPVMYVTKNVLKKSNKIIYLFDY